MSNSITPKQTGGTGNEKPQTGFWEIQTTRTQERVEAWKLIDRIKQLLTSEPDFLEQGRLKKSGTSEWVDVRNVVTTIRADDASGIGSLIGVVVFGLIALPIYFIKIGSMSVGWAIFAGIAITVLITIFMATKSMGCGGFGALAIIGILSTGQNLEETLADLASGNVNNIVLIGFAKGMAVMAAVLAFNWLGAQVARPIGLHRGQRQYQDIKRTVEAFRAGKLSKDSYNTSLNPGGSHVVSIQPTKINDDTQESAEDTVRKCIHAIERQDEIAFNECFVVPQIAKLAGKSEYQFELKILEKIETEIKTEVRVEAKIHSKVFEKWGKYLSEPEEKSFTQTYSVRKLRDDKWYIAEILTDVDGKQQSWKTS